MNDITIRFCETPLGPVVISYRTSCIMTKDNEELLIKNLMRVVYEQTEATAQMLYPADPPMLSEPSAVSPELIPE